MRSLLIAIGALAIGVLGALGYSHYLGEGKQLAELQDELSAAQTKVTKVTQESQQAKSETAAMSAQIQQLTATKEDLKKQLDDLKSPPSATNSPASIFSSSSMSGFIKAQRQQKNIERLAMLKSRLHLTPDQEAAIQAAMDAEGKNIDDMAAKMLSGQKIDPQSLKNAGSTKSVEQTLSDILTPDQKTAYQQMKTDEKNSSAEMQASVEMNQVSPLLQLSESQKDQVETALYQVHLDTQDPAWAKKNANASDPTAYLNALEQAKEDALSKVLTPDQLATYRQQAQAQLKMQEAMMRKFMPAAASAPAPAAAPANP